MKGPALESRTLDVAGRQWRYQIGGHPRSGTLFLLTGGLGEGLVPESTKFLSEDYLLMSATYPALRTMSDLVEGVIAILDAERIEKAGFFGASMGGTLAQCLVRAHPERSDFLILANTSPPVRWGAAVHLVVRAVLRRCPEPLIKKLMTIGARKMAATSAEGAEKVDEMMEASLATVGKAELLSLFSYTHDYLSSYSFSPGDLEGWRGRILILESDKDSGVPKSQQRRMHELYPSALVHTFVGGGHTPSLNCPDEFHRVISEFLLGG